jgi:hypothetical protein
MNYVDADEASTVSDTIIQNLMMAENELKRETQQWIGALGNKH